MGLLDSIRRVHDWVLFQAQVRAALATVLLPASLATAGSHLAATAPSGSAHARGAVYVCRFERFVAFAVSRLAFHVRCPGVRDPCGVGPRCVQIFTRIRIGTR